MNNRRVFSLGVKLKKLVLLIAFLCFYSISLYANIMFEECDLNQDGDILFSIKRKTREGFPYKSLFIYSQQKKKIKQLSFFPERLELLGNNRFLQISNNGGFARIDLRSGEIYAQSEFEAISQMRDSKLGLLKNMQVSPDGRWISMLDPSSPVFGKLVLLDTLTEKQYVLTDESIRNLKALKWSSDSKTFLYEEGDSIYFARTDWFSLGLLPDKKFRLLGKGDIKNLSWISDSEFIFLSGSVLYTVRANELFTKSFYAPIFPIGKLLARLPVAIDPAADKLFISPDGKTAIFVKSKRNIYYFKLSGDDYVTIQNNGSIPFLVLPGNTAEVFVYWKNNLPVIFSEAIFDGETMLSGWQVFPKSNKFKEIPLLKNSKFLAASPNFKMVALNDENGVSFYNTDKDWKKVAIFNDEKVVSAIWKNDNCAFLGGENSLIKYTLNKNLEYEKKQMICLTGVNNFSWSNSGDKILVEIKKGDQNQVGEYIGNLTIKLSSDKRLRKKTNTNSIDRIYIDSSTGYFKNMIYIRSLQDYSTKPLFAEPIAFASKPIINEPSKYQNTSSIFSHGKRAGKKQVAFAFDAIDNIDGVGEVLYILNKNNIKATFFINGEAIRQNPNAVREIVKAGHQCGSLFFTTWDLNDESYRIDEDFIKQGLARNEDIFYVATDSELSLIWHSPNYVASTMIVNAGKKAGYIYVLPDIITSDWINEDIKDAFSSTDNAVSKMVEDICLKISSGSIIPISLGKTFPSKGEYLHSQLQLLIDVIKEMGYSITDVKSLMEK